MGLSSTYESNSWGAETSRTSAVPVHWICGCNRQQWHLHKACRAAQYYIACHSHSHSCIPNSPHFTLPDCLLQFGNANCMHGLFTPTQGRFPLPHYTYDVYVAATAEAVRLVDFNPIGGTTAPLLFEWEELPFGDLLGKGPAGLSGGNDSNGSGNSSSNDRCSGSGVEGTSLTGAAGEAAVGAGRDGSAYGAGAETTAAAAAVAAGAGEAVGEEAVAAVEVEVGRLSLGGDQLGESAGPSCSHANASCPGCSAPAANGSGGGGGSGSSSAPRSFEFRVIEKPVCMRPHKLHYGVPFDFVDSSEGSALDQLRRQMEGAAAGELFAALQKQAS